MSDISQKVPKLASALYFITSFFDDKEPTKWRLRALATDLVSERISDKSGLVREMLLILDLVQTARLISVANHAILVQELVKLEKEAENHLSQILSSDAIEQKETLPQLVPPLHRSDFIKDKTLEENKTYILETKSFIKKEKSLKKFGAVSVKKNGRQSIIISLLKRKKEIMIKDVSSLIDDCSEKTIQRELSAMVALGILRKIGEKRWSRYSLA